MPSSAAAVAGGDVAGGWGAAGGQLGVTEDVDLEATQTPPDVLAPQSPPTSLKRGRRKVISRGGHYIVWSKGGASPWSSTTFDAHSSRGSVGRHHREYSWSPPGDRLVGGGPQVGVPTVIFSLSFNSKSEIPQRHRRRPKGPL